MIRLLLALLLVPTLAWADEPPTCVQLVQIRVGEGNSLKGPTTIGGPEGVTITVLPGFELRGPLKIEVCDGHVTISKD